MRAADLLAPGTGTIYLPLNTGDSRCLYAMPTVLAPPSPGFRPVPTKNKTKQNSFLGADQV